MKWFLYHIIIAFAVIWPVKKIFHPEIDKPLIFLGIYSVVYLIIWLLTFFLNRRYFFKLPKMVNFILYFIKESIHANFRVAYDILTPEVIMNPAIIAVPLDASTDFEIVTLASAITLTPGTLSLNVSEDRKTLYVHEMYVTNRDVEKARMNIKSGFEKKILELTR